MKADVQPGALEIRLFLQDLMSAMRSKADVRLLLVKWSANDPKRILHAAETINHCFLSGIHHESLRY